MSGILARVRMKTPGNLRQADAELDFLARKLEDLVQSTPRPTVQQARSEWLEWYAGADMKLRELFIEDDLVVPLANVASEIRRLKPLLMPDPHGLSFLFREKDVWVERLDNAAQHLKLLDEFVSRPGRVSVLDTSAFHEFDRFWLADWAKVTDADPPNVGMAGLPIRLVVPLVVVDELDSQKRHPSGKVRAVARDVLRHLRELERLSTDEVADVLELSERVTLEILLDPDGHFRLPDNDAEVISQALFLRSLFPSNRRVILITGDVSMEFRAEGRALEVRHGSKNAGDDDEAT